MAPEEGISRRGPRQGDSEGTIQRSAMSWMGVTKRTVAVVFPPSSSIILRILGFASSLASVAGSVLASVVGSALVSTVASVFSGRDLTGTVIGAASGISATEGAIVLYDILIIS